MLTPEQMEEAVEAAMKASNYSISYTYMEAALTAAMPVIERAVLERAATLLEEDAWKFFSWGEAASEIRALAEDPAP